MFPAAYFYIYLIVSIHLYENIGSFKNENWFEMPPVQHWANEFGKELWSAGILITEKNKAEQAFKTEDTELINGTEIIEEIAKALGIILENKTNAVKNIVEAAEKLALLSEDVLDKETFKFENAKNVDDNVLKPSLRFFGAPITEKFSTVHVPTNVYESSNETMVAITWSEKLDTTFASNYVSDPKLSWQYFASKTGFMRLYPGTKWGEKEEKEDRPDIFDSRLRPWYIGAAASPKDMIILIDNSGSMMGQKREIAEHTINTILETLTPNDFVNVLGFNNTVQQIVECYKDKLVQANLENIQQLKLGVKDMISASGKANFTIALMRAFEILEEHRNRAEAAMCNQAIMLVTDGASDNFKEIFEKYNWRNSTLPPFPIRVFTYQIGRDGTDNREIKWMACANQGYYVQLNTMTEVREQVLKYIHVMSRPLVLEKMHIISWTSLYADITDPKLSSWLWVKQQNEEQRNNSIRYLNSYSNFTPQNQIIRIEDLEESINSVTFPYNLMTSVSLPVFNHSSRISGDLLGVAATDIPITVFRDVLNSYRLGVNNYGFIVDNNGYIIYHPELRPVFQGILKPRYNSIDVIEIELLDDETQPRNFNESMKTFRDRIINQTTQNTIQHIKYHYDNLRRASRCKRTYYMKKINETPFTAVISIAENSMYRLKSPLNMHLSNVKAFFHGMWSIHPNWLYYRNESFHNSQKDDLKDLLNLLRFSNWSWPADSSWYNKELIEALVSDANATQHLLRNSTDKNLINRFMVVNIFISTRSGLTKWEIKNTDKEAMHEPFEQSNIKSIDEIWYKRAVIQCNTLPDSFFFWMPANTLDQSNENSLITASHAIFVKKGERKAPAAVVGFQFKRSALDNLLLNITGCYNQETCATKDWTYFVLDHNGYIVVSKTRQHLGKFFGKVHGSVMRTLIGKRLYKEIKIFDYQAACFHNLSNAVNNSATTIFLFSIKQSRNLINWIFGTLFWWFTQFNLQWVLSNAQSTETEDSEKKIRQIVSIARTRPDPCDKNVSLYELQLKMENVPDDENSKVVRIPHTNLVLIVMKETNESELNFDTVPQEIIYQLPADSNIPEEATDVPPSCYKVKYNWFSRRRVKYCKKEHAEERLIQLCGKANVTVPMIKVISLLTIVAVYITKITLC